MRKFSSYGPVNKKRHFYVPRTELANAATTLLIGEFPEEGGHYMTVWAPRQCGKTWIMREALWRIQSDERFTALKINLEETKGETDPFQAVRAIAEKIQDACRLEKTEINSFREFGALFSNENLDKPLILILDEFDSLDETVIAGITGVFRNIYIDRCEDRSDAFHKSSLLHGIALVGVRSVLGVENVQGSPFNVQRSMHIPNLTFEEVRSMFLWYSKESGRAVENEVVERIYGETRGQPGLVSWFGQLLTEGYEGYRPDGRHPISPDVFETVFEDAVSVLPNNNILNIVAKARQEPFKDTVLELFKTRDVTPFRFDDPRINFLYMNGVISWEKTDDSENAVRFSSPFVQKRLFNFFSREIFQTVDRLYDPMTDIEAVAGEDGIDVPGLMKLYRTYLDENRDWLFKNAPRRKTDLRIFEAVYHFNLYMYLKAFFQDKGGEVFPEFPTGNGKIDILIRFAGKLYALELKSFKDRYAYKKARSQAAEYAVRLGVDRIFLVFFIESIDDENRRRLEEPYRDDETGIVVEPLFLETGDIHGDIQSPRRED